MLIHRLTRVRFVSPVCILLYLLLCLGVMHTIMYFHPPLTHQRPRLEAKTPAAHQNVLVRLNNSSFRRKGNYRRIAFLEIKNLPLIDLKVLEYLRDYVLKPPSALPYIFTNSSNEYPSQHTELLKQMFGAKTTGFFIECGANDGEFLSNTLELEMKGWRGLLVEAHPDLGKLLETKHRKAWFANVCLSPYKNISEIEFTVRSDINVTWKNGLGKLVLPDTDFLNFRPFGLVPCFPLVSLMAAMDVKHVDYFSLDVEGAELLVLETLPFDDTLVIDYIQVESNFYYDEMCIQAFLDKKGYDFLFRHEADSIYRLRV